MVKITDHAPAISHVTPEAMTYGWTGPLSLAGRYFLQSCLGGSVVSSWHFMPVRFPYSRNWPKKESATARNDCGALFSLRNDKALAERSEAGLVLQQSNVAFGRFA